MCAVVPVYAEEANTGSVYMLNDRPETDVAWQALAASYTEQTGIEVTVVTPEDGEYDLTLQSEMADAGAPTIYVINNSSDAATWDNYTYDLTESAIYEHLSDHSFSIEYNNKIAGVAYCYECYGIIYNQTILNLYCEMDGALITSAEEINSLETLVDVAGDITDRLDEINEALANAGTDFELTGAFTSAGLDSDSSWRFSGQLAGLALYYEFLDDGADLLSGEAEINGTYLDQFKQIWDMYITYTGADAATLTSGEWNARDEFGMGKAVFYQNGDWEYTELISEENGYQVTADDISMIPIYFGVDDENEGLAVGSENYWAVNSQASEEDISASLAFLEWVITSDEGRASLSYTMNLTTPFDTFEDYESGNKLTQIAKAYEEAGKTSVAWSFCAIPNAEEWSAEFISVLAAYSDSSVEWDAVVSAFIDGWAEQWVLNSQE
ncbi:MAG: ABC transporter substrate-binding protein [Clostridiales bacterium]|nr:ABC transporter substrate-binding protein [Clostridiales bacterium]